MRADTWIQALGHGRRGLQRPGGEIGTGFVIFFVQTLDLSTLSKREGPFWGICRVC